MDIEQAEGLSVCTRLGQLVSVDPEHYQHLT